MAVFFSIDSIISGFAVLVGEDGMPLDVPAANLPASAKPGDMLFYSDGKFRLAPNKTAERRERVADMLGVLLRHGDEETELRQSPGTQAPVAGARQEGQPVPGEENGLEVTELLLTPNWPGGENPFSGRVLRGEDGEQVLAGLNGWETMD